MMTSDIKYLWQKANDDSQLNTEEIRKMINGATSGAFKKIRNKLIIEVVIYLALTYAFVDLFDVLNNNVSKIVFAGALIAVGILNNIIFYRFLKIKIVDEDLKSFLMNTIKRLKRQLFFRMFFLALFIFSMVLILIPDLSALVRSTKGLLFLFVVFFSVGIKLVFENQAWRQHINNLTETLQHLEEE